MASTYIPGFTPALQSQPTAQPVQAEPYVLDLGDWAPADLSGLQNLFFPNGLPPVNGTPEEIAAWQAANARTPSLLDQYIAEQTAKGYEVVSLNPYQNSGLDAINYNIWNTWMPQEAGHVFRFDTGNDIGVPDGSGGWTYRNAGQVVWTPGTEYTMYDKTGKVLGKASTPEEMDKLVTLSEKSPFYTLEKTADPNPSIQLGGMMPSKTDAGSLGSMLVNMAALALPAVGGAALGPVLAGGLGTSAAVGTGLGTAIGTAAAGTAAGKSIEDILLQSALAGIAAGGLSAITGPKGMPDISDLQTQVIDGTMSLSQATNALAKAGASAADVAKFASDLGGAVSSTAFPTVIGNIGGATLGGAAGNIAGGAIGAGLGALTGAVNAAPSDIVVEAAKPTDVVPTDSTPPLVVPPTVTPPSGGMSSDIVVEAAKPTDVVPTDSTPPLVVPPTVTPPSGGLSSDIVVEAAKPKPISDAEAALVPAVPPINSVDIPDNAGDVQPVDKKSDLDKIIDYLRLAGLGISTIGSLFGKGGDGGTPISVGRGSLNPVFSAQLPSANLPGLTGGATGPRPASALPQTTQDWYRYGYGPEQSFFNYVPQTAANTSQAYTGYAVGGYAVGGYAVGGPGDGRDDKIPAMLSDGEYVIDAETVAMLGNGSSKAGAEALDNFRVNVRKHKGRQLAKGQFSVKAKKPEQYLKGCK